MRDPDTMRRAYLAALPEGADPPDDAALVALHDAGRAAWPDVVVDPAAFARHLGSLAALAKGVAPLPRQDFAADVYLACACALGNARAIEAFERAHAASITRAVTRVVPALADEAAQLVRERLLVRSADGPPRIAEYAGRAPLGGWLNTVAVRTALNLRRDDRLGAAAPFEEAAVAAVHGNDPELDVLVERYKPEIEAAVRNALGRLTTRERTILRLHLEQRMTVDALAAHYGTSRATAGRWLKAARDALSAHARADLVARLGLTPSEVDSVVRVLRSQIEVSVLRLLREENAVDE